jgi:hypothetical protein
MWKAFEQLESGPGVASFITASSWLNAPGFMGLRKKARELADEIYVIDLGGDSRGARRDENVFPIQTPVAIVTLVRLPKLSEELGVVNYQQITGTRDEKLAVLPSIDLISQGWHEVSGDALSSFTPVESNTTWDSYVSLTDIFPWQQPGCKFGRTWPIAPSKELLITRWETLVSSETSDERKQLFSESSSGRGIHTKVGDLPRISELKANSEPLELTRYTYRPFDTQWCLFDPRLAKTESPSLWNSRSDEQIFLVTKPNAVLGSGPAAHVSRFVPDMHAFFSGGKDVIPLYRTSTGEENINNEGLRYLREKLSSELSARELFAYAFGILAGTNYVEKFSRELENPGPRLPITNDIRLFKEMVFFGSQLLSLQIGEPVPKSERLFKVDPFQGHWIEEPKAAPLNSAALSFDANSALFSVGDGVFQGLNEEIWNFEVDGQKVVKRWLAYRTLKGAGKSASSANRLDQVRITTWDSSWSKEFLDLCSVLHGTIQLKGQGSQILDKIVEGKLIPSSEFPLPTDREKAVPKSNTDITGGLF